MARLGKDRGITDKAVRAIFMKSWITLRRELFYPMIVEVHDSHVEEDFAAMIGTVPQIEEAADDVDDPAIADFVDYRVDWKNRLYKAKISLSRSLLDFDQTGQSRTLLHSMAARLANWPERLLVTALVNGTDAGEMPSFENTATPFFDENHDIGGDQTGTVMSNLLTGSTSKAFIDATAPQTVAQEILADFRKAKALMHSYFDDRGEPFHLDNIPPESLLILCAPALEIPMRLAFTAEIINATTNKFANAVGRIVATNYLGTVHTGNAIDSSWYIFHIRERVRPIKYSRFRRIRDSELEDQFGRENLEKASGFNNISMDVAREMSSIELSTNLGNFGANAEADVIKHDRFLIGARWRGAIFPGEWRNAIKVAND